MSLKPKGRPAHKPPTHFKFPDAPEPIPEELKEGKLSEILAKARLAEAEAKRMAEENARKKIEVEKDHLAGLRKLRKSDSRREFEQGVKERARAANAQQVPSQPDQSQQTPSLHSLYKLSPREQRIVVLHTKASTEGLSEAEKGELQELESGTIGRKDMKQW